MMIAQEYAKLVDDPLDWAVIVPVGTFETFTGMSIDEAEPP
jgi:hypothetical protein